MTPDASLPPADVQRPEPLAEEELAEIDPLALAEEWFIGEYHAEHLADRLNNGDRGDGSVWEPHVGQRAQARADAERIIAAIGADRLIAGLRASRAEVERLRAALELADNAAVAALAEVAERAGHPDLAARLDGPHPISLSHPSPSADAEPLGMDSER